MSTAIRNSGSAYRNMVYIALVLGAQNLQITDTTAEASQHGASEPEATEPMPPSPIPFDDLYSSDTDTDTDPWNNDHDVPLADFHTSAAGPSATFGAAQDSQSEANTSTGSAIPNVSGILFSL